ncbi:hypothetical protein M2R29_08270 [Aeromonas hydrophila]|uniref:hypothetical protein n=1 Tax=Aeromonas hydrophila TaxID=644 RepID=UPI00207CC92E|nr:hypothetical protein [Aeromonas hydrophila]MCO4207938.1 hypothetical protein [Aeromonas hydrophila]
MYELISKWLDLLERLLGLIRPNAYNSIAKSVVFTGIGLIVESQVNFIHALVVALFEQYIGKSDILREVLIATDSPSLGIFLVVMGMAYHIVVTLGKDYIQNQKAKLPKFPELIISISTPKKLNQVTQVYMDGPFLETSLLDDLPIITKDEIDLKRENEPYYPLGHLGTFGCKVTYHKNMHLYKQRLNIIEEWAGFEPLAFQLTNLGKVLANGVRVEIILPKENNNLSILMPNKRIPHKPEKLISNQSFMHQISRADYISDFRDNMRVEEKDDYYTINWNVDKLQAGTEIQENKLFLLRVKDTVEIECTIFCDQLPKPKTSTLTLTPSEEIIKLTLDDIVNDERFDMLYNQFLAYGKYRKI